MQCQLWDIYHLRPRNTQEKIKLTFCSVYRILAACIPCLKQPFQRLIYRVGALGDLGVNRRRNGYLTAPDSGAVAHESPKSWNSQGQELQMRTTAAIE